MWRVGLAGPPALVRNRRILSRVSCPAVFGHSFRAPGSFVIDIDKVPWSVCAAQDGRTIYNLVDAAYERLPLQPLIVDACQARIGKSIAAEHPKRALVEQADFRIDGQGEVQFIVAT